MANKTVTVKPSGQGGTYTTLAAAIAGEVAANANLVTMAGILTISIEGTWSSADTTAVDVTGFTVSSSYYVNIVTDATNKAGTSWSTSKYYLTSSASAATLTIRNAYTRVTGLQVTNTGGGATGVIRLRSGSGVTDVLLDSVLVANSDISVSYGAFHCSYQAFLINCIVANITGSTVGVGFYTGATNGCVLYNCTAVNCSTYGFYNITANTVYKNCYAGGCGTADYYDNNSASTLSNCYSEDGTRSTTTAAYSTSSGAYFINVGDGTENVAIGSSSTLIAAGTNLRADATWPFDYDIVGTTRGASWDVGAFEYVSAGGISVPVVMQHLRMQGAL